MRHRSTPARIVCRVSQNQKQNRTKSKRNKENISSRGREHVRQRTKRRNRKKALCQISPSLIPVRERRIETERPGTTQSVTASCTRRLVMFTGMCKTLSAAQTCEQVYLYKLGGREECGVGERHVRRANRVVQIGQKRRSNQKG